MSRDNKLLISVFLLVLVFLLTPPCSSTRRDADDDESDDDVESSEFKVKGDESEFKVKAEAVRRDEELNTVDSNNIGEELHAIVKPSVNKGIGILFLMMFIAILVVGLVMVGVCCLIYFCLRKPGESYWQTSLRADREFVSTLSRPSGPINSSKNANKEVRYKEMTERYDMDDLKKESANKERLLSESDLTYGTDEASGINKKSKFWR